MPSASSALSVVLWLAAAAAPVEVPAGSQVEVPITAEIGYGEAGGKVLEAGTIGVTGAR